MSLSPDSFLRRVLVFDAVTCGAMAVLLIAATGVVAGLTGLPAEVLRGAAIILIPFALFLVALARQQTPSAGGVKAVIAINILWVVASAALLLSGRVDPTLLGTAFVIAQALAVLGIAELEIVGFKRLTRGLRTA